MGKKIYRTKFPTERYEGYTDIKLSDSEIDNFGKFDWLVYYYGEAPYEGEGYAICKKDELYYYQDLGHCSCYEPTDHLEWDEGKESLEELVKVFSEDLLEHLQPLLDVIKEKKLQ